VRLADATGQSEYVRVYLRVELKLVSADSLIYLGDRRFDVFGNVRLAIGPLRNRFCDRRRHSPFAATRHVGSYRPSAVERVLHARATSTADNEAALVCVLSLKKSRASAQRWERTVDLAAFGTVLETEL
jgi:hypothetical protein